MQRRADESRNASGVPLRGNPGEHHLSAARRPARPCARTCRSARGRREHQVVGRRRIATGRAVAAGHTHRGRTAGSTGPWRARRRSPQRLVRAARLGDRRRRSATSSRCCWAAGGGEPRTDRRTGSPPRSTRCSPAVPGSGRVRPEEPAGAGVPLARRAVDGPDGARPRGLGPARRRARRGSPTPAAGCAARPRARCTTTGAAGSRRASGSPAAAGDARARDCRSCSAGS